MYVRIDRAIQGLRNDPFPRGIKKLRGEENRYRIREGNTEYFMKLTKRIKQLSFIGLS